MKIITRKEFEKLYYNHTNAEIAKMLQVQTTTIYRYAKKFGLPKKKAGRPPSALKIIE